ncbi:MAG: DUF4914 family protein [Planctomycetota bacterium]|nr:MAG: DUF4914 family protein [Planctomycetota bacterium]
MSKISSWKDLNLPADARAVLEAAPSVTWFENSTDILEAAVGGPGSDTFTVSYDVPGKGVVDEVVVNRVKNGIAANYTTAYMRRRDPDCMFIADKGVTDKTRFQDSYGEWEPVREAALEWLKGQNVAAFAYLAGRKGMGVDALVIAPANAGFFALGLAQLQGIIPLKELTKDFNPKAIIYVAPPFRHTHFNGKQVVAHNRTPDLHELFSFNLYPGPSAKKGIYGVLLTIGEREGWVTNHCSTVQVVTPYDNTVTIMHEGASGGGKSEMLEQAHREADGRVLLGRNVVTGEKRHLEMPRTCDLFPVTDDMALAHPSIQKGDDRLYVTDAEEAWFLRVNHITGYGTDPFLEKATVEPKEPLLFLSVDAVPGSTALIWEPVMDEPGKPCPNPRVVMPRRCVDNVVDDAVGVDIRSFGVRCPPCTKHKPTYGIMGLVQILPPALAWLWRLTAPRGHANPSIVDTEGMSSEGVGSYWPFCTGRRVDQANLLLEQFGKARKTRYIICPNQHVGAWEVGFAPQWIAREYLARRGGAKFKSDKLDPARCPLLGYSLYSMQVEGRSIARWFLEVNTQPEVGDDAYDAGAAMLYEFFEKELAKFTKGPGLSKHGREIIQCCLDRGGVEDYEKLLPAL